MNKQEAISEFNIITLGDSGVGKTTFILRYTEGIFKDTMATIGFELKSKSIEINGIYVSLKIWDTAGQERFRNISTNLVKNADGIFLFYDITNRESFNNITYWFDQIESKRSGEGVSIVLIGCKCDLERRKVSKEEAKKFANEKNIPFYEISSVTGVCIDEAFEKMVNLLNERKKMNRGKTNKEVRKTISLKNKKGDEERSNCHC